MHINRSFPQLSWIKLSNIFISELTSETVTGERERERERHTYTHTNTHTHSGGELANGKYPNF
jgi:hypothetical protein